MPKLQAILRQLEAPLEAARAQRQAEIQAAHDAKVRVDAETALVARIAKAIGFSPTDLAPVLSAIKAIPQPEAVDFTNLIEQLDVISNQVRDCMETMASEGKMTRKAMPKAPEMPKMPDMQPLLDDLQWLKTFMALKKDPVMPVIPERKEEWTFTIERDRQGFIKTIKAS